MNNFDLIDDTPTERQQLRDILKRYPAKPRPTPSKRKKNYEKKRKNDGAFRPGQRTTSAQLAQAILDRAPGWQSYKVPQIAIDNLCRKLLKLAQENKIYEANQRAMDKMYSEHDYLKANLKVARDQIHDLQTQIYRLKKRDQDSSS